MLVEEFRFSSSQVRIVINVVGIKIVMVKYTELSKLFFDSDLKIGMIEVLNKDALM